MIDKLNVDARRLNKLDDQIEEYVRAILISDVKNQSLYSTVAYLKKKLTAAKVAEREQKIADMTERLARQEEESKAAIAEKDEQLVKLQRKLDAAMMKEAEDKKAIERLQKNLDNATKCQSCGNDRLADKVNFCGHRMCEECWERSRSQREECPFCRSMLKHMRTLKEYVKPE